MHHSQVHTNKDIKKDIKEENNSTLHTIQKISSETLHVCLISVYMLIKQESWALPSYLPCNGVYRLCYRFRQQTLDIKGTLYVYL